MAEHPRSELLRLLKAFTPQGEFQSRRTQSSAAKTKALRMAISKTKAAVANIEDTRGVSTEEAVSLLQQTGRELAAARRVIVGLGRSSAEQGTSQFTSSAQLVANILKARGSIQTSKGTQANLSPVSTGVAQFAAKSEIDSPSGRLRVFATRSAASDAERRDRSPRSRNRPGR